MIEFLKTSDKENIFKSKKKNDTLHIELKKNDSEDNTFCKRISANEKAVGKHLQNIK